MRTTLRYLMPLLTLVTACTPNDRIYPESTVAEIIDVEVRNGETSADYLISWEIQPSDRAVNIFVSIDPQDQTPEMIAQEIVGGALNWSNSGDAVRHYFTVSVTKKPSDGKVSAARLLPLEGGRNFRDLGGYQTEDGRFVKWGRVFRSGTMNELSDNDYDYLSSIGIKVVCDFREREERSREPTRWKGSVIEYLSFEDSELGDPTKNPLLAALFSSEASAEDVVSEMAENYVQIAKHEAVGYSKMFDRLAQGDVPLAFNCSAGKDRAGTAAALLLTALGVPRETVVYDYSLSDVYVDYTKELIDDDALSNLDSPYHFLSQVPKQKIAALLASDPRYIEEAFDALELEYGSVLAFIQSELNVTESELEAIKSYLLE